MTPMTNEPAVPSWAALNSSDLATANEFYSALFNWKRPDTRTAGASNALFLDELPVAGVGPRGSLRPAWRMYVDVPDLRETARRVIAAGGKTVAEPDDHAHAVNAVFADAWGAEFGARQLKVGRPATASTGPGSFRWCELITDDIDGAAKFYASVFGWSLGERIAADPLGRRDFELASRSVAGILPRPPTMPKEIPSYWDICFDVADPAAIVEAVNRLGGKTLMQPTNIAHGRIAVFTDPSGVVFSVLGRHTGGSL